MYVKFLKERFYRGKKYKKDDVVNMSEIDCKAYFDCKVVEHTIKPNKNKTENKTIENNENNENKNNENNENKNTKRKYNKKIKEVENNE